MQPSLGFRFFPTFAPYFIKDMTLQNFYIFLVIMTVVAVVVFVSLFFVDAGYGKFYNKKWGPAINNKLGWVLMESPVFIVMLVLWLCSDRRGDLVRLAFLFLFELHYFQRSFVFPFRLRGNSVMPLSIILMGVTFNVLNALMQGGWVFYISPDDYYGRDWLTDPRFIIGFILLRRSEPASVVFRQLPTDALLIPRFGQNLKSNESNLVPVRPRSTAPFREPRKR